MGNKKKNKRAKRQANAAASRSSDITPHVEDASDDEEQARTLVNSNNQQMNAADYTLVDANQLNQLLSALNRFSGIVNPATTAQATDTNQPLQNRIQQFSAVLNSMSAAFENPNNTGPSNQNPTASGSSDNAMIAPQTTSPSALTNSQTHNPISNANTHIVSSINDFAPMRNAQSVPCANSNEMPNIS